MGDSRDASTRRRDVEIVRGRILTGEWSPGRLLERVELARIRPADADQLIFDLTEAGLVDPGVQRAERACIATTPAALLKGALDQVVDRACHRQALGHPSSKLLLRYASRAPWESDPARAVVVLHGFLTTLLADVEDRQALLTSVVLGVPFRVRPRLRQLAPCMHDVATAISREDELRAALVTFADRLYQLASAGGR